MIKFTQIAEKLNYPPKHRSELTRYHTLVINYVIDNFSNTYSYRKHIVDVLNTISYSIMCSDYLPSSASELIDMPMCDMNSAKNLLGNLFLTDKQIIWDISEAPNTSEPVAVKTEVVDNPSPISVTDKTDLYIKPPAIPQFNYSKVWMSGVADGIQYVIYTSLPEVPTKQNQISCTTDINDFTDDDLMKLFPTNIIRTRHSSMYEQIDGIPFDETLGILFEIDDFTIEQVRENIIKYPHLYQLTRMVNDEIQTFYKNIEIDGQLQDILDVWDTLPDTSKLPKTKEFIKEYVVRRYLLERDIKHIKHNYPMFGSLDPFLTVFMPPEDYKKYGYEDSLDIMRKCVESRVSYKQSRNPIVRRLQDV